MDPEEFTAEEQAAMTAMQSDTTTEAPDPAPAEEPAAREAAPAEASDASEPAAEPAPEGDSEDSGKPPEGYVPHGAMHRERELRKQAEARGKQVEAERRQLEERLARLEAAMQPKEPEQPAGPPDIWADPDGYNRWQLEQQQRLAQDLGATREELAEMRRQQQMSSVVQQTEAQFRQANPDYDDAVSYLAEARQRELSFLGYDEAVIQQQIAMDVRSLIQDAMQRGKSPAEVAYHFAQARGYRPAAPAQEAAHPPQGQKPAAERITAQAAAQAATQSLSGASGPSQAGRLTMRDLAAMPEEQFSKLSDEDIRRAAGG